MGLIRNLKLRHRAYLCAYNAFRFGARLRGDLSEFAPSVLDTIESVGDELAVLARDTCRDESERRCLLDGLGAALKALELSDAARTQVVELLTPRVLAGDPANAGRDAWQRMAV